MPEKLRQEVSSDAAAAQKPRRGQFMRDTASLVAGSAAAQVITVALTPVITRLFSPEVFGIFALVMALVGPCVAIAGLRYHEAIMLPKSESEARALFRLALLLIAGLGLILSAGVYLFGPQIAALVHLGGTAAILYTVPVLVVLVAVRRVLDVRMQRGRAFGRIAMATVSVAAVDRAISIGAGLSGYATPWALAAGRIGGLVSSALWMFAPARHKDIAPDAESAQTSLGAVARRYAEFAKYSWSGLVQQLNRELPVIVLGASFGVATAGLFALARRVVIEPGLLVGDALSKTFYQRASEIHRSGRSVAGLSADLIAYLFRWIIPPMALFACVAPDVFALVFGAEWRQAGTYAVLVSPVFITGFVMQPLGRLFNVLERQREWASYSVMELLGSIAVLFVGALSGSPELLFVLLSLLFVSLGSYRARWILSLIGVPKNTVWPILLNCLLHALLWAAPLLMLKWLIVAPVWVDITAAGILISAYLAVLLIRDPRFNKRFRKRSA